MYKEEPIWFVVLEISAFTTTSSVAQDPVKIVNIMFQLNQPRYLSAVTVLPAADWIKR